MNAGGRAEALGVLAMVVATASWGATFVVIRDSLDVIDARALVFLRFGLAGLLFAVIAAVRRPDFNRASVVGGIVSGVFGAGGYLFQAIGLESTSAGSSAFLTAAGTILVAFIAWPLLRQRPESSLVTGIGLALVGAALLTLRGRLELGEGELWTLLGALIYALQIVAVARYAPHADPLALVTVQTLALTAVVLPLTRDVAEQAARLDATGWARLAYLAVAASVISPFLQVLAQRVLSAGRTGLLFALEPVFGVLFAVTMGGERFVWHWWLGAALILSGIIVAEWPAVRRKS